MILPGETETERVDDADNAVHDKFSCGEKHDWMQRVQRRVHSTMHCVYNKAVRNIQPVKNMSLLPEKHKETRVSLSSIYEREEMLTISR